MYRLGTGWRLRSIDDRARFGMVEHIFGGTELWRLDTLKPIGLPQRDRGLDLVFRGMPAIRGDQIIWTCASAIKHRRSNGEEYVEYVDARVMVATLTLDGIGRERYIARPERWGEEGTQLLVTVDGQRAVIVAEDGFDIVDLQTETPIKTVDLGQVIHSIAISRELEDPILGVGLFGKLVFFRLDDGEELGRHKVDNNNVVCAAFGQDRFMALTEDSRLLYLLEIDRARPVDKWAVLDRRQIRGRAAILTNEGDLSHDGKLRAIRRRRKDVVVFRDDGSQQVLGRHTDRVCLVRFVGNGSRLVTADKDNRVFYWPRIGDRIITG